jgi:protein SCO1/2
MKFVGVTLLVTCMACAATVFAKDSLPFTILSTSIDAPMKPRQLPDFSLVERSGKKITLSDLRGKVWIADFVYTHCTDTCPLQSADMAKLQERWMNESDVELVSFSIDPGRDTPHVLSQYANRLKPMPNAGCS